MEKKHLDARGKGEYTYDYPNDILLFKTKDRDYAKSLEFGNLIVDVDTEGFITGLRLFDASKILKLSKITLKHLKQFEFNADVEDKIITIQLRFTCTIRNAPKVVQGQDFIREALSESIQNSEVICSVA